MSLSKEQILSSNDLKTVEIEVPEWEGTVLLRDLSGKERDSFEEMCYKESKGGKVEINMAGLKAKILCLCIVDESGVPIFSLEDVSALNEKNGAVIDRLYSEAQKLTRLTNVDVEELTKNLKGDLNTSSGSGSPDN